MVSCCLVSPGTRDGVTLGIGLSRALECGVCLHAGPSLSALHVGGRRLVMKLRPQSLWTGRAALRAGRCEPDLSFELCNLHRARPAVVSAAAAEHDGSYRGDEAADRSGPLGGLTQ
jgi:hypothetical protein